MVSAALALRCPFQGVSDLPGSLRLSRCTVTAVSESVSPWTHDRNIRSGAQMCEYVAVADRVAKDHPGRKVLDWGCGYGHVSDLLKSRGMQVTAFEYDPDNRGQLPLELYPHISALHCSEPVRLPYTDNSFDTVLSCGVLEHVPDPSGSLGEIKRVLKPSGMLYVFKLANRHSYLERLAKRLGMYYHGKYEHDRLYTLSEARNLLSNNGYLIQEIRMANMLPLTFLTGQAGQLLGGLIWRTSRALARIPGLNRFATNVELVAIPRPSGDRAG